MPIDYSRWDNLVVSDDDTDGDEASSGTTDTEDALVLDLASDGNCDAPARTWTLEAQVAKEEAQVRWFVRRCPCPDEAKVLAWLALDLHVGALSHFSYSCYHRLWHAAGQSFGKQVQRSVGQDLYARGGIDCMRLHFYMLSYAWRGEYFYPAAADRPIGVLGYHRSVEFAWHGIGSWLA